jgi:tetratricopeptide (TPR) repeat protein
LKLALQTKQGDVPLSSRLNVARVQVAQGQFQSATSGLQPILNAESTIPANLAIQMNLVVAEAAIGMKDYARAEHTLEQQLAKAQRSGMHFELARIYYLLGKSARMSGSGVRAAEYYQQAAQLLDSVDSDPGAENILHRTDVKTMYDECNHWKKS